jgi:YD repeat-containing protein
VKINRKHCAFGASIILLFLAGGTAVIIYPFDVSEEGVTVDIKDMRYACGDCYVRFGVIGTYDIDGNEISDFDAFENRESYKYNGWDALVVYKGNAYFLQDYQEELHGKDENCSWPVFRLKGQFKRKIIHGLTWKGDYYDGLYFDATSGVAINNDPDCKTVPRETILP